VRAWRVALLALLLATIAIAAALLQRTRFAREAFAPGDRVRIRASSAVAPGEAGTVTLPPLPVTGDERGWSGHVRHIPGAPARFWVTLDRPLDRPDAPPLRGLELTAGELDRQR
jgi:hypothetical protein